MTLTRVGEGRIVSITDPLPGETGRDVAAARDRPDLTGRWRQDIPFSSGSGLQIQLRREPGVTTANVLRVPLRFQTPVINDFSRPYRFNVATFDPIGGGQRDRAMSAQLLDLSVDTLLMDAVAAAGSEGLVVWEGSPSPQGIIRELNHIAGIDRKIKSQVFRLIISQPAVWGDRPIIDMLARLTAVTPTQKGGEAGTEYLTLGFLEHVPDDLGQQQRPLKKSAGEITYRLGDTLQLVAMRSHYHRASAWRKIADASGIKGVAPQDPDALQAWLEAHGKITVAGGVLVRSTKLKVPAG